MIVILASRYDGAARALAECWQAHDARVLTARDLSLPGWQHRPAGGPSGTAVVGGEIVPTAGIRAALTLLPGLWGDELAEIEPGEREYAGAELTAFLLSWLGGLACPVLNRPTPTGLAGPLWRQERWISAAVRAGIPVRGVCRRAALGAGADEPPAEPPGTAVTVIGRRSIGRAHETLHAQARLLARLAGVEMLVATFEASSEGARFLGAHYSPNVLDEEVADALLDHLRGGSP